MKHLGFDLKKYLILLVALLALTLVLAACGQDEAPPLDSGTDTPPADDRPIVTELPLVSYHFVSNGDGTCSIGGIITNPKNGTEEVHLDIPETSPDGDTVTAINDLSLAGSGNIPRMILKEDYEKIDAALRQKVESGEMSKFYYMKYFYSVYTLNDPDQASSPRAKEQMLKTYPITAISPIYILWDGASAEDYKEISRYLSELIDYDMYDALADYNHMVEVAKASELCTNDMLSNLTAPYGNESITISSVTIPKYIQSIEPNFFNINNTLTSIQVDSENPVYSAKGNCLIDNSTQTLIAGCQTSVIPTDIPVTSIGSSAFRGCSNLTRITIPEGVTSISSSAFSGCSQLIQTENGVSYVDKWVIDCDTSVTSLSLRNDTVGIGDYAFSGCSSLTSISIPDSVTSIGDYAFSGCSSLTSIIIPNGVTSIYGSTFYGCSSLTSISIPDSVTSIGNYAFSGCSSLTSITIPNSVTNIGSSAFSGCNQLIQKENGVSYVDKWIIDCDESVTSVVLRNNTVGIGDDAFYGCSSLTSITIPDSVTSIGYKAFIWCESLTSITISKGVTSIGNYAFYGCSSLTSILIPDSVTSIGRYAFFGCSSLTSITIPDSVTSIGYGAFIGCSSLTSITIPDSVTSIGNYAFSDCSSLTNITIPGNVTSIGRYAFIGCNNLTIYAEAPSAPSGWDTAWNDSNRPVVWGYNSES